MDAKLCTVCSEPATYGDGLTWALCSRHNLEQNREQVIEAQEEKPLPGGEAIPHKTVEGLTSIIIPVYNQDYSRFHYTGHCIGSIRYFTKKPYEIIVVDNGSPIDTKPEDYGVDKVIKNSENRGYVKAVNQGIRAAFGEYIAVICTDVCVFENWLEDAQEALQYCDLVYAKPMYGMPFARAKEAAEARSKWLDKSVEESLNNDLEDGSAFFTTKKMFDTLGTLLDERYFNYAADRDLYRMIRESGGKALGSERIRTFHIIQGSGFTLEGNAEIMNKDKAEYEKKWQGQE